jgi:hypothetical protein
MPGGASIRLDRFGTGLEAELRRSVYVAKHLYFGSVDPCSECV